MGLTTALARLAARHAHVLVVEAPGSWGIRSGVEREVVARGWSVAASPADADILAVCGKPGERVEEAVEQVWQQMPGPRVRVDVSCRGTVVERLDAAHAALADTAHHQRDARERPGAADLLDSHAGGDVDMGHDMDDAMEMAPGGIPLAEGGPDRDGLEMDVLHVPLGPVLPYWPGSLVLHCKLQGDVIVDADAEVLDGGENAARDVEDRARVVDHVASILALSGWRDAAAAARRIRDDLLEGGDRAAGERIDALRRRVCRSRMLRRSLRGVGRVGAGEQKRAGLPPRLTGDTHDRLLALLQRATEEPAGRGDETRTDLTAQQVASLVVGLDLATARLVVASLGIHELVSHRESHAR